MQHFNGKVIAALFVWFSTNCFALISSSPASAVHPGPPGGVELPAATGSYGAAVVAFPFSSFASFNNYSFIGHTRYQVFVTTQHADDLVISVFGDAGMDLALAAPDGLYNSYFSTGGTATETGPDAAAYDSNMTIDLTSGPVIPSTGNEGIVVSGTSAAEISSLFHATNGLSGAVDFSTAALQTDVAWGVTAAAANAVAGSDFRVQVLQLTSPGSVSGTLNAVVYPHGNANDAIIVRASFTGGTVSSVAVLGCVDVNACNYSSWATEDDGSCTYPATGEVNCAGFCISDTDNDGVCDADEVAGCGDASACNYNAAATDPGDCTYPTVWYADADGDGLGALGSSQTACTQPTGYVATAGDSCPNDPNKVSSGDCGCGVADLDADSDGLSDCNDLCTDLLACNFAASPSEACTYPQPHYDCSGVCLEDADSDGVCDALEVDGCTDSLACNYEVAATEDDASCLYPSQQYLDCAEECLNDADSDGICDELEIPGCSDPLACNFDSTATDDDGSCTYCDCAPTQGLSPYSLTVEAHAIGGIPGTTTYRIYVNTAGERDAVNALFADGQHPFVLTSDAEPNWYQTPLYGVDFGMDYNEAFLAVEADLAYDSWFTFGAQNSVEAEDLSMDLVGGTQVNNPLTQFNAGEDISFIGDPVGFNIYTVTTCNRFALPGAPGACPDDYVLFGGAEKRVLVAQITTEGVLSGSISVSILPEGIPSGSYLPKTFPFEGEGTFSSADWEGPVASVYQTCGCTDEDALNFDDSAVHPDDSCIERVYGCMDQGACNYDASANTEDNSCTFGSTWYADLDGDGLGDAGATTVACELPAGYVANSSDGCPMDPDKEEPGACGCGTADTDADGDLIADCADGCSDATACNFSDPAAVSCEYPEEHYSCDEECINDADSDGVCDELEVVGCQVEGACNYLVTATDPAACTYPVPGYDCGGSCINDADGDLVCDEFEVPGCQDASACNYNASATDPGDCDFPDFAYNCNGDCLTDTDGDGVCDELEVSGCQDSLACNYNASATDSAACTFQESGYDCEGECLADADGDGVCDPFEVPGCDDPAACNYADGATDNDGSCTYPEFALDCDGDCLNDANGNSICDELEVFGCTDEAAYNFDAAANVDDGSCAIGGCTNHFACNFNALAQVDDGSCVLPVPGYDCDGECVLDSDGDGICDGFEVYGCTDPTACNFDDAATENFCCSYGDGIRDCTGSCLSDADGDGVCDEEEVVGCTDPAAWNYQILATEDDGFCIDEDPEAIYDAGYFAGSIAGANIGFASGYDAGYADGVLAGEGTGYDAGYADGVLAGEGTGYDAGYADGVLAGEGTGYDAGYADGVLAGEGTGYDAGYADGVLAGEATGYDAGVLAGEESGYAAGYAAGLAGCSGEAFCGEGTEWHPDLEVCLPLAACLGDLDGNAVRGTNDLLLLLSVFGDECE